MELSGQVVDAVVAVALREDVGAGDRTTEALFRDDTGCSARIWVEEQGVVCGIPVAAAVFAALDPEVSLLPLVTEGTFVEPVPVAVAELSGPARAVLTGERTALNLVARLSGVATLTRQYVDAVAGTRVTILDTRKTTPGLRALEKYAVRCGGGANHRLGLDDAILVKENHLRLAGGITAAARSLAGRSDGIAVEVEAETLAQVEEALAAGVTRILLDNMAPAEVVEAVALVDGRATLEASGGITLDNVRTYAETGVDFISIGALTHSARSLHISLEVQ
jgi:nicotinate-nucleotide pyrophosphorylase (carboxylating)